MSVSERLFCLGLWPATPVKPNVAFTLDLMEVVHNLVLECQSSLHDIHSFLRLTGKKQPKVCSKELMNSVHVYV